MPGRRIKINKMYEIFEKKFLTYLAFKFLNLTRKKVETQNPL